MLPSIDDEIDDEAEVLAQICPPGKGGEYRCGPCSDLLLTRRAIEYEETSVIPPLGLKFTALGYARWLEVRL
jgi:hypothetical protein